MNPPANDPLHPGAGSKADTGDHTGTGGQISGRQHPAAQVSRRPAAARRVRLPSSGRGSDRRGQPDPTGRRRGPATSAGLAWVLPSVTVRDRRILALLDEHGTLTTPQLTTLFFGSPITAAHRLYRLYTLRLLDRFTHHHTAGTPSPWHWTLGVLGARLTALAADRDPPSPAAVIRRRDKLATSPRLGHLLGVNQFFTTLAAYTRHHPGTALHRWWSEQHTTTLFGRRIRPDGHGVWSTDEADPVGFFLEHDTGTERPADRLVAKLASYARLVADGGPAWPVLFWLPTPSREQHLHQHLDHLALPMPVATAHREHRLSPAGPVWRLAGTDRARLHLADLPCAAGTPGPLNPGLPAPGDLPWPDRLDLAE